MIASKSSLILTQCTYGDFNMTIVREENIVTVKARKIRKMKPTYTLETLKKMAVFINRY